jgi:uncharacterized Zn finger protein (UPF0148 family)
MAKFCGKCGSRLDENTGLCPKCNPTPAIGQEQNEKTETKRSDSVQEQNTEPTGKKSADRQIPSKKEKKQAKQEHKREKRAAMSRGQKVRRFFLKLLLVLLLVGILAGGTTAALVYFDVVDLPFVENLLISMGLKEREALPEPEQEPSNGNENLTGTFEVTPPRCRLLF